LCIAAANREAGPASVEPAGIREKSRRSGAFARFIAKIHKIVGLGRNVTKSMDLRKSSRAGRRDRT
jgi:hypothetical protein